VTLDGFVPIFLAFAMAALAGQAGVAWGLGAAFVLSAWYYLRHSGQVDRLRLFSQRLQAGDFSARIAEKAGPMVETLRPALDTLAQTLSERFTAAEETRRHLVAALNGMREGVVLCDAEGAVLLMNPAFRRLAGFQEPILRRYFLWEAVRDPDLNAAVDAALRQARPSTVDLPLLAGSLEGRALVTPIDPLPGGSGGGAVVLLFDRTQERRVERLRSEFVANVSHELRTPLSAIKAVLETLKDGALDDPAVNKAFVDKALHHSERLEELLTDLLTLSQIEEQRRRGQVPTESACQAADAWSEAESLLEPALKRHQGQLKVELGPLPRVRMDKGALRQILLNYVENALKHSGPQPKVSVGGRLAEGGVELWVQDQGQGIPEEDLPRVFERFYRVDKARTRVSGGSGLGLSIVKHLAENNGAVVGVDSQVGKGSRFWVRLQAL
jgi:two-component system phosphate regulon sensor histidine kinase PhoR